MKLPNVEKAVVPQTKITEYLSSSSHSGIKKVKRAIMIQELDCVALIVDLPEYGLKNGDIGTAVLVYNDGEAYEVEFMTREGETVALITLLASQVRSLAGNEMPQLPLTEIRYAD